MWKIDLLKWFFSIAISRPRFLFLVWRRVHANVNVNVHAISINVDSLIIVFVPPTIILP